jgi:2-amino-4-hydroxy-6-hydroxymethyldihydropteridine diphosphokinase
MSLAYLLLGSNLGDSMQNLQEAIAHIGREAGKIRQKSKIFKSPAWGFIHANAFLNQALALETKLTAEELLKVLLAIEKKMGRLRKTRVYEAREIDIDILFYDAMIMDTETLTIPHPRLHQRQFALRPMLDLAPKMTHPLFGKTIISLANECEDRSYISVFHDPQLAAGQKEQKDAL